MKRYQYPIAGLIFAVIMLLYLWLSPLDRLNLQLLSATGDQAIMDKLNVRAYLFDEDAQPGEPSHYSLYIQEGKASLDINNPFEKKNRGSDVQKVMSQFSIWHRPSRTNTMQAYSDKDQSLWLQNGYYLHQPKLKYTIINHNQQTFKDYEYQLQTENKSFQGYIIGGILGTEDEYQLLIMIYKKNEKKPAEKNKQKLVTVTINKKSGEVTNEEIVNFDNQVEYFVSYYSDSSFNPNYFIVKPMMAEEMTGTSNRGIDNNHFQLYDHNFDLVSKFKLPKTADQTNNWVWVDGENVYLLTNGLLSGLDESSVAYQKPESFAEITLYRLNIDKGTFDLEKRLEGNFESIKVYQGQVYFVENMSKNQRKIHVYDPSNQTMVYQGTWQASSPKNHEVSISGFDLTDY